MKIFPKIFNLLNKSEKILFFFLFLFMVINSLLEIVGIGLLIPLIGILIDKNDFNFFNQYSFFYKDLINSDLLKLNNLTVLILFIFFIKNILIFFYIFLQGKFVSKIKKRIVHNVYQNYIFQDYNYFMSKNSSEIIKNINESQSISVAILSLMTILLEFLLIIFMCYFLLSLNFNITLLIILFFTIVIIFFYYLTKKKLYTWGNNRHILDGVLKKNIYENIANIKEIKVYHNENFFINIVSKINKNLASLELKVDLFQQSPRLVIEFLSITFLCAVIFFKADVNNNSEFVLLITVYVMALVRLMPSATRVSSALQRLKFHSPQINLVYDLLNLKVRSNSLNKIDYNLILKNIKILNLSFRHKESNKKIFNEANLNLKVGTINCIIGENGSGKSTLSNLLLGLLQQDSGKILINNKIFSTKSNNKYFNVGYVPQHIYLLDDTIKKNIFFGSDNSNNENSDLKLIDFYIKKIHLGDFINNLPKGINTVIGERGIKISGGQIQKIGILRALIRNPNFLILDEFNSNLDKSSENIIMKYLSEIKKNKIIIIISHKKNVFKYCDNIFKIDSMKIKKI
jgi:ABC-type bacteriocin/lantibiotic exporter with double-glycine peptidase domain